MVPETGVTLIDGEADVTVNGSALLEFPSIDTESIYCPGLIGKYPSEGHVPFGTVAADSDLHAEDGTLKLIWFAVPLTQIITL